MKSYYHSRMEAFISAEQLPVWVVYMAPGSHPERRFHDHDYTELALILSGSGRHLFGNQSADIHAGDLLLLQPGDIHSYDQTGDLELVNILFDRRRIPLPLLDGYSLPLFRSFFPRESECSGSLHPIASLTAEEISDAQKLIQKLTMELMNYEPGSLLSGMIRFMDLLVLLARTQHTAQQETPAHFFIGDAVNHMNRHYSEAISIESLARSARMSRRTFFRQFKEATGYSPMDYLIRLRIHQAAELLITTNWNISEISEKCGFSDSTYFCRLFHKHHHTSPRQFRLQYLQTDTAPLRLTTAEQ